MSLMTKSFSSLYDSVIYCNPHSISLVHFFSDSASPLFNGCYMFCSVQASPTQPRHSVAHRPVLSQYIGRYTTTFTFLFF